MKWFRSIVIFFLLAQSLFAQSNKKEQILDTTCNCLDSAYLHQWDPGFDYNSAYDHCMNNLKIQLTKMDKKYSDNAELDHFKSTELDSQCSRYYPCELLRAIGSMSIHSIDPSPSSVPTTDSIWLHYSGINDEGMNMELMIRFLSRDTFEFMVTLDCKTCADTCEIFTNNIASYKKGSTFYLALKVPRRVDRVFSYDEFHDKGWTEISFHFVDNHDPTKGIYVDKEQMQSEGHDVKIHCRQHALEKPLTYTGTSLFKTDSPWSKKQVIIRNTCTCIGKALAEQDTTFDYEIKYQTCKDSFAVQMERIYPEDDNERLASRFCYELSTSKQCDYCNTADSMKLEYFRRNFHSIASAEECAKMKTGAFTIYGDTANTKIDMGKKKQTIRYADGTYTISKIEWLNERSFTLTRIKSTNPNDLKKRMVITYELLRVKDQNIVYYKSDEYSDPHVIRWVKIPTPPSRR